MMKSIVFNLKINLMRRFAKTHFGCLCLNEKKSLETLLAEQELAKRELVTYAFNEIPFYQQHYRRCDFLLHE